MHNTVTSDTRWRKGSLELVRPVRPFGGMGDLPSDRYGFQPWEVPELRTVVPNHLQLVLGRPFGHLVIPRNNFEMIQREHPTDARLVAMVGQLLEQWELAGASPKATGRQEIYLRLETQWYTVVLSCNDALEHWTLLTLHKIDARKVRSRQRKGYLIEKEQ